MRITEKQMEGAISPSSKVGVIQTRGLSAKAERILLLSANGFSPLAVAKMTYNGTLPQELENSNYIKKDVVERMAALFQRWVNTVEDIIAQGAE